MTDQYSAFDITLTDAYRYIDSRDPFADNFGLSNGAIVDNNVPGALGRIDFASNTSFFTADWWAITTDILVDAYSADGILQGSFSGLGSGTDTIYGDIAYVTWHDSGGFVQLANISYSVPEPSILMLLGIGLAGVGFSRRKKA